MENYSTMSRDRTFRKRAYTTIFFVTFGIIALYGLVFSAENFFGGTTPGGVSGSSYATIETGTRAWSELLEVNGYAITRDRGRATLPPVNYQNERYLDSTEELCLDRTTDTIVVLEGALPSDESQELRDFIEQGGRLITDNPYLLEEILGTRLEVQIPGSITLYPSNEDISGLDDVSKVSGSSYGSLKFNSNKNQKPLLVADSESTFNSSGGTRNTFADAAIFRVEQGDVIAIPNSPIVSNQLLAKNDNAIFSLAIAGTPDSTVTFVEGVHGYNDVNGFAGMPLNWRVAIIGLFVAFIIFATAKGRRFGVGEQMDRNLGPRRIYFAHAIANTLRKSKK